MKLPGPQTTYKLFSWFGMFISQLIFFPNKMFISGLVPQLRGQECLTLESRSKSIPIPKAKSQPSRAPKASAKAKIQPAPAEAPEEPEEPAAPKRRAVRTRK